MGTLYYILLGAINILAMYLAVLNDEALFIVASGVGLIFTFLSAFAYYYPDDEGDGGGTSA